MVKFLVAVVLLEIVKVVQLENMMCQRGQNVSQTSCFRVSKCMTLKVVMA